MRSRLVPLVAAAVLLPALAFAAARFEEGRARGLTGGVTTHVVVKGESLRSVGARYGIDAAALARDNALAANALLDIGQVLRIDNRHVVPAGLTPMVLVVNVPQRMLFYDAGGELLAFPVAVGRASWRTPIGPFTIRTKETDPTWDVPASILAEARRQGRTLPARVGPGPQNPLGKYWLGLSFPGVGIHGTNAPASIYGTVTHGCIRVSPEGIAALFPLVSVGTAGHAIYEPILLGVDGDGGIFLEAHRDVYRRLGEPARTRVRALADEAGLADRIDWTRADAVLAAHDGLARLVGTLPAKRTSRD